MTQTAHVPGSRSAYHATWYQENKEAQNTNRRASYQANKEREKAKHKEWVSNNKEKMASLQKAYRTANKTKVRAQTKEWKTKNKPRINARAKHRRATDPSHKVLVYLRNRLTGVLQGQRKAGHTMELVGCSLEALMAHLQDRFKPGMAWNNYGQWHVDHVRPCASFDLTDPEEQRRAFHYTNLQPLWDHENLAKGDRLDWM